MTSVLVAIRELQELEKKRIWGEEAARQRELATAAEADQSRIRGEQERAARAEAEAKLRVAADLRERDVESERRIAALRAELASVQASRRELADRMADRMANRPPVPSARRSPGWTFATVAWIAVGVGVGAVFVPGPADTAESEFRPASAETAIATRDLEFATPPAIEPESIPPVEERAAEPPAIRDPERVARPPRTRPPAVRPERPRTPRDPLADLDRCGNDPICAR